MRSCEEREIFQYHDGQRERRADPMVVRRLLMNDPEFSWESDPAILAGDDEMGLAALARTLKAIGRAFGVSTFNEADGSGLTEDEHLELYAEFMDWLQKKSEKRKNSQTSQPSATSTQPGSITESGSASSSIATESTSAELTKHDLPSA